MDKKMNLTNKNFQIVNIQFLNVITFLLLLTACNMKKSESIILDQKAVLTQDGINPVIDKWLKLWETYDLNMLDAIFLQTKDLTYFSSEKEGLMIGYQHLKLHHSGFGFVEGGKQPEKSLWLEDMETKIYGETAMVAAIWYFGDKNIVKDSVSNGPVTFIFIKDKQDNVKIAHTHFANY